MPSKVVTVGKSRFTLDARPDQLDLRDRAYAPRLGNLPRRFPADEIVRAWLPRYSAAGLVLDQVVLTAPCLAAHPPRLVAVHVYRHAAPWHFEELFHALDVVPGE